MEQFKLHPQKCFLSSDLQYYQSAQQVSRDSTHRSKATVSKRDAYLLIGQLINRDLLQNEPDSVSQEPLNQIGVYQANVGWQN